MYTFCRSALLKSHAAFMSYIKAMANICAGKASTPNEISMATHRKNVIQVVAEGATVQNQWKDVNKRMNRQRTKMELCKKVMKPDLEATITSAIKNYYESNVHKSKIEEAIEIHNKIAHDDDVQITAREYDKVATLAHGVVSISNGGRASTAGAITNYEYSARRKVAADEDFSVVDGDQKEIIGVLVTVMVTEDRQHKTGHAQNVFISAYNQDLVYLYHDVKDAFFRNTVGTTCKNLSLQWALYFRSTPMRSRTASRCCSSAQTGSPSTSRGPRS